MLAALLPPSILVHSKDEILEAHAKLYRAAYLQTARSFPDVGDLFRFLRSAGHRIALATTWKKDELEVYDRSLDILCFCDAAVCGSDVKRGKPHPDLFEAACRKIGVDPVTAIAIGDSPYDAQAASQLNMKAIGVRTGGFEVAELEGARCAIVLDRVSELAKIVPSLAETFTHYQRIAVPEGGTAYTKSSMAAMMRLSIGLPRGSVRNHSFGNRRDGSSATAKDNAGLNR